MHTVCCAWVEWSTSTQWWIWIKKQLWLLRPCSLIPNPTHQQSLNPTATVVIQNEKACLNIVSDQRQGRNSERIKTQSVTFAGSNEGAVLRVTVKLWFIFATECLLWLLWLLTDVGKTWETIPVCWNLAALPQHPPVLPPHWYRLRSFPPPPDSAAWASTFQILLTVISFTSPASKSESFVLFLCFLSLVLFYTCKFSFFLAMQMLLGLSLLLPPMIQPQPRPVWKRGVYFFHLPPAKPFLFYLSFLLSYHVSFVPRSIVCFELLKMFCVWSHSPSTCWKHSNRMEWNGRKMCYKGPM